MDKVLGDGRKLLSPFVLFMRFFCRVISKYFCFHLLTFNIIYAILNIVKNNKKGVLNWNWIKFLNGFLRWNRRT